MQRVRNDEVRAVIEAGFSIGGLSKVLRRGPRKVKIACAQNHTKLSHSRLSQRWSAPFVRSVVWRLPAAGTDEIKLAAQSRP